MHLELWVPELMLQLSVYQDRPSSHSDRLRIAHFKIQLGTEEEIKLTFVIVGFQMPVGRLQ